MENKFNGDSMGTVNDRSTSAGVRPAGVRPAGVRPAGVRPAGVRPVNQTNPSQFNYADINSKPDNAMDAPSQTFIQKPSDPQPVVEQAITQGGVPRQPKQEHILKNSEHQRVIESIPVKFDTDPNKKNYVLYMIIDKPIDGMLQYFRSYGLNVSKIFSRIEDARNALMMQVNPARIVIIDTGNGAFNSMSARKQVIDIIGLGDEENKVTVFYSDTNLKYEIEASKEIQKKALSWYKYKTTTHTLACLLQSKDCNYISEGGYKDASSIVVNLDETLWLNPEFKDAEEHSLLPMVNSSDVSKLVHDPSVEQVVKFTPILR